MKILYWTELFYPHIGGVQVLSMHLLPALVERGHDVHVIASHSGVDLPDRTEWNGIPVHRFHFQKALAAHDLKAIKSIANQVVGLQQDLKPDILHVCTSQPGAFFHHLAAKEVRIPVLFSVHEPPRHHAQNQSLTAQLIRNSDWVAAVSNAMLHQARRLVPGIENRSSVLYNGLPFPVMGPAPLPFSPPQLLAMGRVVESKGLDMAVNVLSDLQKRHPSLRLVLAGDGPARDDLEKLVIRLGLEDRVEFTGWVLPGEIPHLINSSTMLLAPSRWDEPFGLVALQAGQLARPAVVTQSGGLPEVVKHGETGFCVPVDDDDALAAHVDHLLRRPELAADMGWAGRARAKDRFGFGRMLDELETLYCRITGVTQ